MTNRRTEQLHPSFPQVLQRAVIPTLAVTTLDANAVIECYYLTRQTVLHGTSIKVTKAALGLRYRPTPSAARPSGKRLELTLEYGPARAGRKVDEESIPRLSGDAESSGDEKNVLSLSWENEAKVYYTELIDSAIYTTANYLASLSGTVLDKLLNSALDFVEKNQRRYQPFSIYMAQNKDSNVSGDPSEPSEKKLVRSSNDVDFLHRIYELLAELGVEMQPVISPSSFALKLHAVSVEKMQAGDGILKHEAAKFYQNLYACVNAISSGNYSTYNTTIAASKTDPSISPTFDQEHVPISTTAFVPSLSPMAMLPSAGWINSSSGALAPAESPVSSNAPASAPKTELQVAPSQNHTRSLGVLNEVPQDVQSKTTLITTSPTMSPTILTIPTTQPDTDNDDSVDIASHTEQAAQAAMDAQDAADAAGNADTEDAAVSAAQKAASAAQKAAVVTADQAAKMARDALLSGDGTAATQTLSLCFQDSIYGLTQSIVTEITDVDPVSGEITSEMKTKTSPVVTTYLYWDGLFYYRVNLTAPYVTTVSIPTVMPQPPVPGIVAEDVVDWTIAFFILCVSAIGFVLLLQQVMGRNFRIIRPLYKYQRWFFQPTHYNLDMMDDDSDASRGVGQRYTFGEDVIPLSMGGRRSSVLSNRDDIEAENWLRNVETTNSEMGSMEMVQVKTPTRTPTPTSFQRHHSGHSERDDDSHSTLDGTSIRLFRDPGLVDMPDLKSKSKVAVPVSVSRSRNNSLELNPTFS